MDRHKIIALTQSVILQRQPLRYKDAAKCTDNGVWRLNVEFAFLFGIEFLSRWNEMYYPESRFDTPTNHFHTETFLVPLLNTDEGTDFIREHTKYLMARRNSPFPLFLIAQLWFVLEQWGLTYARNQKTWPREKNTAS
ncbi:MAG: hypothetical protein ACRC46_10350 [Thermoguttaceae bacterium]